MKWLGFAFLAGLASACGFEPWALWPLTLAALALLLWLVETAPSLRSALARGYAFGAGQFMLGLNWIATSFTYQAAMPAWLGWLSVMLVSLYLAIYPAAAAGLAWRWSAAAPGASRGPEPGGRRDRLRLVLVFAAAWIVTEWLRASLFTGFAWNPVGVSLIATQLSRLATVIGSYGLSGVAVLLAGVLLLLLEKGMRRGILLFAAIAVAGGLVSAFGGGGTRPAGPSLRIVQPNIGQEERWREEVVERNFAKLRRLSSTAAEEPRLLLWPESAVVEPLQDARTGNEHRQRARQVRERVGELLGPRDLLLTGGVGFRSADGHTITSATNSVFAIGPGGRILGRYDKAHLVPYGEYLPMRPWLTAIGLSRLAPGDVDFDSGPGPQTLDVAEFGKVGFQICYEIIFSGAVIDRANRPSFLFNPSNDAWFGAWGPPQHLAQARLRALEEGVPVLRSTPTGISAVIDAEGRLLHSIPWRTAGVIDAQLPGAAPPTLFARFGNSLSFLFALLLVAGAIAVRTKAR
ncbi:MAG TPA: apolipoprotein N-acyltransferase [Allosphingosinicella sp.]|nr:apolipoprotein N-acyltransferase [Allosphingosinicella sp.]